ncbi:sensor histidine kinase N-terminal domain-containing protein [Acinetobacter gyllenbergii]|uniref:ATP-binding protein n=1 Tax=Acinetobacter gyllenbergii TaxID=134534 RepID=UPI0021D36D89|nr:ATP-binding protein [Acinetobacter gyllenbergii]MCU4579998.1 sensor histidine kinase N-terminal domain-containing protein [Acinetobacter gyllenbergii]
MKNYSLKWRLVTTICFVFILLWSLVFYWLYVDLEKRLQQTLDERLSASALMVAHLIQQLPVDQIMNSLDSVQQKHNPQNLIVCEVSLSSYDPAEDQQVLVRTQGSPSLTSRKAGFSTWQENGIDWRSYVLQKGQIRVVTAEKLQLRYSLLKQILQSVLMPLIITLILCILLILWIIRIEFLPLDHIAQRLRKQQDQHSSAAATDLLDLNTENIPKEIQPFVDSIFALVHNLHQSLENEKSFSAFAAHELRSPLTAIKTHVQLSKLMLMHSRQDQQKLLNNLEQAEFSIQRYEQLLEQLLLLSKTETLVQPELNRVDVTVNLKQVINELEQKYHDLPQQLEVDWNSLSLLNLPDEALKIVLKNLIENAYLHAQAPIQIYMQTHDLVISDTGHGLNDHDLSLLTQRFWRKSAHNNGHGLGLALVKLLLEKHGFTIRFSQNAPNGLKVVISQL